LWFCSSEYPSRPQFSLNALDGRGGRWEIKGAAHYRREMEKQKTRTHARTHERTYAHSHKNWQSRRLAAPKLEHTYTALPSILSNENHSEKNAALFRLIRRLELRSALSNKVSLKVIKNFHQNWIRSWKFTGHIHNSFKIWGFHGGDYEEWCLLGCYAVWLL
jgi:hypothetical protein